jgi:hypothetical protein
MKKRKSQFCYETSTGFTFGFFNIYQSRHGEIVLAMGNAHTVLSYSQVHDLQIDIYSLLDFDYDDFKNAYYLD